MTYSYVIYGKPLAKTRPRFKQYWVYDKQAKVVEEIRKDLMLQNRCQGLLNALQGPIYCKMNVYTNIPKSVSKRKRSALDGTLDLRRNGDLDNFCKMYMDALNGIAYEDDRQIVALYATKIYDENPRVEITIQEIDNEMALKLRGRFL